jgi:DNA transformation protein
LDAEFIQELFAQFRPVTVRRMFSGAGISIDGINFAILIRGVIYLKVDDETIPEFEREGSQPFTYTRSKAPRKPVSMSYWRLPERLYDDPEELSVWAERAFEIARRQKTGPAVSRVRKATANRAASTTRVKRRAKRGRSKQ